MVKKTDIKRMLLLFALGIMFLFSIGFVSAGRNVTMPASGANFSASAIVNISFINESADITVGLDLLSNITINVTFFRNSGTTRTFLANATACVLEGSSTIVVSCWGTATITAADDGLYNITALLGNGSTFFRNNTVNTTSIKFDSTPPVVFAANISNPARGLNYSGLNLLLNVTLFDAMVFPGNFRTISSVYFNVTNLTGGVANLTLVSVNSSSMNETIGSFFTYINTTGFPDGRINITVFANDSLNNINSTAQIISILFDNTVPRLLSLSNPARGTNFSGNNLLINATIIDDTANVSTLIFNVTNFTGGVSNLSLTATREGTTPRFSTYVNTTGFPDGRINITIFSNDTAGNINATGNLTTSATDILFDNTVPSIQGFAQMNASGTNNSGNNFVINVTIVDATSNLSSVFFNITNSSGGNNASIPALREGTGKSFVASVNTSDFIQGRVNITVFSNDTAGNINATSNATLIHLIFDNTVPQTIALHNPAGGQNYSGSNLLLNATIIDINSNVSFVAFNITNSTGGVANATITATREGSTNRFSTYANTTGFPGGRINITIFSNDTLSNINASGNGSTSAIDAVFDNVVPSVLKIGGGSGLNNFSSGTNYSGNNLQLNITVLDLLSNISTVYFNITNSSNANNASIVASRAGTTNVFTAYINTSAFTSGRINITVFSNDTAGTINTTENLGGNATTVATGLIFDNIVPQVIGLHNPAGGTNYSGSNLLLNATIIDIHSNVSFVAFNITNSTGGVANATITATREGSTNRFSTYVNTTGFPNGKINITVFSNDTVSNTNNTGNATASGVDAIFDNVVPAVLSFTNFPGGVNYSGSNILINVTIDDLLANTSSVFFNVTNSSGANNATLIAPREGGKNSFRTYVNTTGFPSGKNINITVFTNDTAGNINWTGNKANNATTAAIDLIFDNGAPGVTLTLNADTTRNELVVDIAVSETLTTINTTCTDSDGATDITDSDTTQLLKRPNSNCGTPFSLTVACTDSEGNSGTATGTFSTSACIAGGSSPGGGGSGTGGTSGAGLSPEVTPVTWVNTFVQDTQELSTISGGVSQELGASERVRVSIKNPVTNQEEDHTIGVVSVSASSATIQISSSPSEATLNVGESEKFDVVGDDDYYDMKVTLVSIIANKANVKIEAIHEAVPAAGTGTTGTGTTGGTTGTGTAGTTGAAKSAAWVWILLIIVVVVVVVYFVMRKKKGTSVMKR